MLSLHGNFDDAKTIFLKQERQLFCASICHIFQKRKEKGKKEKRKLSFLAVQGRAVKVFAKKILPEHTRDILRIVRGGDFFCKIHLDLDGPMVLALRGHSLTLLSFFFICVIKSCLIPVAFSCGKGQTQRRLYSLEPALEEWLQIV